MTLKSKQYIDISVPISKTLAVWPGVTPPVLTRYAALEAGQEANISRISMDVHTGTHVDAPLNFLPEGKPVEAFGLEALVGPCYVADIRGSGTITAERLIAANLPNTPRLLRANDPELYNRPFDRHFCALNLSAAQWLQNRNLKLVGIDCLSIETFINDQFAVHKTLLKDDILVLEGLQLGQVAQGFYTRPAPEPDSC